MEINKSANSMTLLNHLKYSFSNKDLSNVKINNANLEFSIMEKTNFENANL